MRFIIDEDVIAAKELFSKYGSISFLPAHDICNKTLSKADALIIRSRTLINEELLSNTPVKFIGNTVSGEDHVDMEFLSNKNIFFARSKGCNANAVSEYVISALLWITGKLNINLEGKSLAVIGVGSVGQKVIEKAKTLGLDLLLSDPPLESMDHKYYFTSFENCLNADFITFHVPLTFNGPFKTFDLIGKRELSKIRDSSIIINTARGSVINELSLIEKPIKGIVIDCWDNEPNINYSLLKKVDIATPHIAGHTYEGKYNGSITVQKALCKYLNIDDKKIFKYKSHFMPKIIEIDATRNSDVEILREIVFKCFPINNNNIEKNMSFSKENRIKNHFISLRKNYPLRYEWNNYSIKLINGSDRLKQKINTLGFEIVLA